jgi:flagellar biosynthesis/type III secretory pathway protein FliH
LLRATFGPALERAVEDLKMLTGEPLSDFFKKYYREGKAEGIREGKIEGKAEGLAEGKVEALLAVLSARTLEPKPRERDIIRACTDLERLDRWIARAVVVHTVGELLNES